MNKLSANKLSIKTSAMKKSPGKKHDLKKQVGMTFIGFVIVTAISLCIVFAGIKIVPAYIEFFSVKKIIQRIGGEINTGNLDKKAIMQSFDKSAAAGYVTVVSGKDLAITSDGEGRQVVSVEYQVVTPLAFNLSALMDFKASTAK